MTGIRKPKKIIVCFLGIFYCIVVPAIFNPSFKILILAFMSLSCIVLHFWHFHVLIPMFCIPFMLVFCFLQLLHICVDGNFLGTLMNGILFHLHLYSILSMNVRGAFNCKLCDRCLFFFHAMMFSFCTAINEEFWTI